MLFNMVLPGAVETARLPKEYQEVEYIQSSGTQYIDTGFKPKQNTKAIVDVQFVSTPTDNRAVFGARAGDTSEFWVYYRAADSAYCWRFGNSGASDKLIPANPTERSLMVIEGNVLTIGGSSVTANAATFSSAYAMFIFAANNAGAAQYLSSMKLYAFQIFDNGTLIRDYVPCYRKADGVVGLYDLVSGVFYTNAGTGTFVKGADVGGTITPPATGDFTFTYSGNYTDNRVDGIGDVTLNTSGTLVIPEQTKIPVVTVLIQGAGGGGACTAYHKVCASGGGGGYQTVEVELAPGTYEIVIGTGGAGHTVTERNYNATSSPGGNTVAFGKTSTGGGQAYAKNSGTDGSYVGAGGSPNGSSGSKQANATNLSGGSPNGGGVVNSVAQPGGDGLVRITFS